VVVGTRLVLCLDLDVRGIDLTWPFSMLSGDVFSEPPGTDVSNALVLVFDRCDG